MRKHTLLLVAAAVAAYFVYTKYVAGSGANGAALNSAKGAPVITTP